MCLLKRSPIKPFLITLLLSGLAGLSHGQSLPSAPGKSVDFLRDPAWAVVTNATPEFGWFYPQSGGIQQSYQIRVASQLNLLKDGAADQWDSGKVESSSSINVPYGGKPLAINQTYFWQVRTWSSDGLVSSFSEPQQFNTGDFDRSKLEYPGQSRWIELSEDIWVAEDKQTAAFTYMEPVRFVEPKAGSYFVEYEKSVIGIFEFTATATEDGTQITLFLGERKEGDNLVNKNPGRSNIGFEKVEMALKKGTHHYIVKLGERKPSHYLHSQELAPHLPEVLPFRFVEINGEAGSYHIANPKQAGLFYYFEDDSSSFETSNETLKKVWDLCKYTLKATPFLGVYADGNRERMPYEADAYIQQMGHYSVDREYAIGKYTINFLLNHASWPTEWQMHTVMMAWQDYLYTGDAGLLEARYDDLRRKTLIDLTETNHLISTRTGLFTQELADKLYYPGQLEKFRDIVDWPQGKHSEGAGKYAFNMGVLPTGETDGYVFTTYNTVVNAFHYHSLELMEKIAGVLGKSDEETFFKERAAIHLKAFKETFYVPETGLFRDGDATDHVSLHANMFPLAFGMVESKDVEKVAEFIKSRGMRCSVYGAHYLLDALFIAGESDYALELMTAETKRSWMNMLKVGSTMTTEAWDEDYKYNLTWNHAWGSAPANSIARRLVGITPIEPGFGKFRIAPQPGSLKHFSLKQECIRGPIEVDLKNESGQWDLKVEIPGNTISELWIPKAKEAVSVNGSPAKIMRTDRFAQQDWNVILLEPGSYSVLAK